MTGNVLIAARRLVDGNGDGGRAWLRVERGMVVARGDGGPPSTPDVELDVVVPGFVDTHVHGALGTDFGALGADPMPAIEYHHRCGSTTLVASVATAALEVTAARLGELAPLVRAGDLAGVHLEGPWLSHSRRGAHKRELLRQPDRPSLRGLLAAAEGTVRMVTLAPELPGASEVIADLIAAGVTVAIGHTDADADTIRRAVDAGATVVTHLYNGMPSLHHRQLGPVGVALSDDRLTVEIIGDGHHVLDEAVDIARRSAAGRLSLVSDAMSATGLDDGRYSIGGSDVVVEAGVAQLLDRSSLAGSTMSVAGAAARLLGRAVPVPELVSMTSTAPARALGLSAPTLCPGAPADLLELAVDGPRRVMRRGVWLPSPS